MPQPFKNAVLTNGGAQLLTRAQAGEISIEFTRIAVGNGTYSAEEKMIEVMQNRDSLKEEKNSYALSNISVFSEHSVKVTAFITNQDPVSGSVLIHAGYYINEMGLYARVKGDESNETEVLYSITVTEADGNGDFMPPYNGYNAVQIIQDYYVTVNNSAEVTIQLGTGAAVLDEDYQEVKKTIQYIADKENIEKAFYTVYTNFDHNTDETAMTAADITEAINREWKGESSSDETAMTAADITEAINREWKGESSSDETALSATDIAETLK